MFLKIHTCIILCEAETPEQEDSIGRSDVQVYVLHV